MLYFCVSNERKAIGLQMDKFSFLNAAHTAYFAGLYDQYLTDPDSVEPSWRAFFQGYDFGTEQYGLENQLTEGVTVQIPEKVQKEFQVVKLIDAYRSRGHLFTKTNPVRQRRTYTPDLTYTQFGFEPNDLQTVFDAGHIIGMGPSTLENIIKHLEAIYCDATGIEYMYIRELAEVEWIQKRLNVNDNHPNFTAEVKKNILNKLIQAVSFEQFLHTKYVGQKRFSLEGGESLIPALDALIEKAADYGVKEFVMGMAHRGRLNVLTNIFGKSPKDIFSEFDGKDYEQEIFDGDVKYHLGWTSSRETDTGKKIHLNIAPNPSHLETVGPVVEGITRAKWDKGKSEGEETVLPILVHGDAAIAGQGVVYEVVQMAQLDGYKTGGTIHIVVNNQVGFTTNYKDGRSSTYCTDVGKVTLSPVLHVNADDVEAVVHAMMFALDYRMTFKRDVFIDLLGYRKYGHNEGDEPKFTQPILYKAISKHKNPLEIYASKLLAAGTISNLELEQFQLNYKLSLEEALEDSRKIEKTIITPFMEEEWSGFSRVTESEMINRVDTTFSKSRLKELTEILSTLPKDKKFIKKIERLIKSRQTMFDNDQLDWSMAEHLAYASLLDEGFHVRLSGQDVERGTFSHRHAVVKVEDSEEEVILLETVSKESGAFQIYNSLLSEYGVVGFDYGYAMASPNTLTIWEAQFGDFSNGAQIMLDQYISSAEDKWKLQNGLVMLLPHGYEGQGAEHSSARMERYLQLCAKDNMFVADCTTPANMFHLLRRQMKSNYRKPLIVFTPKSLLRHPLVVSSADDFALGHFQELIDDDKVSIESVKTVVFLTGKFYYDLLEAREAQNRSDVAIIRVEQLFPLPKDQMHAVIEKYKHVQDFVWAQEEPRNMGAFSHLLMNFDPVRSFRIASRRPYGAPAAGSAVRYQRRHKEIIDFVFDATKDNQRSL